MIGKIAARDALNVCEIVESANIDIAIDVYHFSRDMTLEKTFIAAGNIRNSIADIAASGLRLRPPNTQVPARSRSFRQPTGG